MMLRFEREDLERAVERVFASLFLFGSCTLESHLPDHL